MTETVPARASAASHPYDADLMVFHQMGQHSVKLLARLAPRCPEVRNHLRTKIYQRQGQERQSGLKEID